MYHVECLWSVQRSNYINYRIYPCIIPPFFSVFFYVQNTALDLYTEHSFVKNNSLACFQLKRNLLHKIEKYFKKSFACGR